MDIMVVSHPFDECGSIHLFEIVDDGRVNGAPKDPGARDEHRFVGTNKRIIVFVFLILTTEKNPTTRPGPIQDLLVVCLLALLGLVKLKNRIYECSRAVRHLRLKKQPGGVSFICVPNNFI